MIIIWHEIQELLAAYPSVFCLYLLRTVCSISYIGPIFVTYSMFRYVKSDRTLALKRPDFVLKYSFWCFCPLLSSHRAFVVEGIYLHAKTAKTRSRDLRPARKKIHLFQREHCSSNQGPQKRIAIVSLHLHCHPEAFVNRCCNCARVWCQQRPFCVEVVMRNAILQRVCCNCQHRELSSNELSKLCAKSNSQYEAPGLVANERCLNSTLPYTPLCKSLYTVRWELYHSNVYGR